MCGLPDNWPHIPMVIEGDTVLFHFKSDGVQQTYWGWKCIVHSETMQPTLSWLYDVERTCAELFSQCLKVMIEGSDPLPDEKKHIAFLDSNLLALGTDTAKNEEEVSFLEELIQNRAGSKGCRVFEYYQSKSPLISGTEKIGGEILNIAQRAVIAAILKHMGLISNTMNELKTSSGREVRATQPIDP